MVVCHIIVNTDVGGAERSLLTQIHDQVKLFDQTIVISLIGAGKIGEQIMELDKVTFFALNMDKHLFDLPKLIKLKTIIKTSRPDLIVSWMYHANVVSALLNKYSAIIWNIRHSLDDYNNEKLTTKIIMRIAGKLSSAPDKIVYNSDSSRKQHTAILGYNTERGITIHNGVDLSRFSINEARPLPDQEVTVGTIGRFHPIKDHALFISMISELKRMGIKFKARMAGRDINHQNRELKKLIFKYDVGNDLELLGELNDVTTFYGSIDLLIVTSRAEGFPNVIAEAMACGCPCVSTDVGEARFIIGNTGKLFHVGDLKELVGAVNSFYRMPGEEWKACRLGARNRIASIFPQTRCNTQFADLYADILKRK